MKHIFSILLIGSLLLGILSGCTKGETNTEKTDKITDGFSEWVAAEETGLVPNMKTVLKNDRYSLSMNPETGDFAVTDAQTGQILHSNPCRVADLTVDEETGNQTIASVTIQYYNRLNTLGVYNTIDDCIPYGQLEYWINDDTLRILYTLGKDNEKDILPETLSVETYEAIISKLSDYQARVIRTSYMLVSATEEADDSVFNIEEYLHLYPGLKKQDLYVLRDLNDAKRKRVTEALIEYGFTYENVVEQRRISGIEYQDNSVKFTVPVDLKLDSYGFVVSVDTSLIAATKGYTVKSLELYPGMGATTDSGMFIVPDGSGATIPLEFNDTRTYSQRIYGNDESRIQGENRMLSTAIMPCYAITSDNFTLFADIISGAAAATVQAVPQGGLNNYAHAGFLFHITETDNRDTDANSEQVDSLLVGKRSEQGKISVHYRFSDRQESYAEIAVAYREYLLANGQLHIKDSFEPVFLLDLYGLMNKDSTVLGIPVQKKVSLTTFSQAQIILEQLKKDSVDSIYVRYLGIANGGLQNSVMDHFQLESRLGGQKEWTTLSDYAKNNGIMIYPDAPIYYVYSDGWFDGFSKNKDGCRLISGQLSSLVARSAVDGKRTTNQVHYALSATAIRKLSQSLIQDLQKQKQNAVSFSTVGKVLNSNFNRSDFSTRSNAQEAITELMKNTQEQNIKMMVDTGSLYTLSYADTVVNVPASSSGLYIENQSIPFAQIVMSGCVDYAMRAFNSTSDWQWERLRAIEVGSNVYYRLMYEDNVLLKKTDYEDLNSLHYSVWIEQARESYHYVSEALEKVRGAQICDHTYLTDKVTCTVYDNGVKIYVNYSEQPYVADDITVPAEGYMVGGAL